MLRLSLSSDAGVVVAVLMILIGTAFPWVRKLPAGYTEGEPYYTDELVWGLNPGFEVADFLIVVPALSAIVVLITVRNRDWVVDVWLLATAIPVLWLVGQVYNNYQTGAKYAVEPGLYLVIAGGVLFVLLGASDLILANRRDN